mgnify:CR=1 FL=1|jgi:hypothetical protein
MLVGPDKVREVLDAKLNSVEIVDVHTHLFPAEFTGMLLWGIDEILTYHYLIAEYFRYSELDYAEFFRLPKAKQAELIWQTLFVERSPVSEAQRGVLTILQRLGLDVGARSLEEYREYFRGRTLNEQIDTVFQLARVKEIVMTNDPFDPQEREYWKGETEVDPRFKSSLRIDPLLVNFPQAVQTLQGEGYGVSADFSGSSAAEVRRFLSDWVTKIDALYMAASLPPTFTVFDDSIQTRVLKECVLPVCREHNIPFAMMIGVKKLVNKELGLAGDSVGKAEIRVVEQLCTEYPENKFLVTMLSRENQHELAIAARKYGNLMVFGCWWFLNNPSLVEEITAMRLETLGLSFIPQHSDARVLEHLIYKWEHSKKIIGDVLAEKYGDILATGWQLTEDQVQKDVEELFQNNFYRFLRR